MQVQEGLGGPEAGRGSGVWKGLKVQEWLGFRRGLGSGRGSGIQEGASGFRRELGLGRKLGEPGRGLF